MHHLRKEILIQWQDRKRSLRMIWGYRSIRWNHWQECYFRYCKSIWPLTRAEEIMMNGKQGMLRRTMLIPSIRPAKDEKSLGQSVLPEALSLNIAFILKHSIICSNKVHCSFSPKLTQSGIFWSNRFFVSYKKKLIIITIYCNGYFFMFN